MSLKDRLQAYKYNEDETIEFKPEKVAKPKTSKGKKAPKESTAALLDLPPSIAPGITVVFVGFNPGVESSKQQHHYAHFTNLFWKLFNASDLLRKVLARRDIYIEEHGLLKELYDNDAKICTAAARHDNDLLEYGIGFTDLVLRCTKSAQELSKAEKVANVPRLMSEFNEDLGNRGTVSYTWV
ncbi:uncharacterized protein CXQ87_004819 [Candidozyma duobushaemuli]|uniref:Uracil-DNA glycosylase-like domain-containing protein n=1 Tax=Candidozyma duobushaemuli TaxID=1231522 RepID=A0A2V1AFN9_9ASCO|nr:uncharacterized protein CXQ87_004819 [[Candida] duobushaemulonis]PVH16525.1 hypothetical protein CXQ87_004819 [[Candida] duobushaemulonis]